MKKNHIPLYTQILAALEDYENTYGALESIITPQRRDTLIRQMIDSVRRIQFITTIRDRNKPIDNCRADANSLAFDPLRAAILLKRSGNIDEAFWLVFLATHFGKHKTYNWSLAKGIYSSLGGDSTWTWDTVASDVPAFLSWLDNNKEDISQLGSFSNHRKYENLDAYKTRGTGSAIKSYVDLILSHGNHATFIEFHKAQAGNSPEVLFDSLYDSLDAVITFGRVAKFDYLTMIGKIRLAHIEPGKGYLKNATGPLRGARLLFGNDTEADISVNELESNFTDLATKFDLYDFRMQLFEDALCNWQKNPDTYTLFRG